jgi:predicted ABC-type ATPase
MKTYTIIAGVNGVGKNSLTGALTAVRTDLGIIIDTTARPDDYSERINSCLEKGINFTQETTLSGVRTIKTMQKAKEKGYFIRLYYIGVSSAEESIMRIQNRVKKGGHDIPAEDVMRRFDKRFESLSAVLPYCDEAVLFDNENGFKEVAVYKNGTLSVICEDKPEWLRELLKIYLHG